MAVTRYILALIFLAVSGGLIYAGVNEQRFALVDSVVTAICLVTGVVLIWTGWRMGRAQREERRRRRQYRDRRLSRRPNGGPDRPASR